MFPRWKAIRSTMQKESGQASSTRRVNHMLSYVILCKQYYRYEIIDLTVAELRK
jgi:hypothetical protein